MTPPNYRFARFAIGFLKVFAGLFMVLGALALIVSLFDNGAFTGGVPNPGLSILFGLATLLLMLLYGGLLYGFAQVGSAALDGAENSYKILERLDRLEGKGTACDTE